jgi:L-aminopeptidase/D-esterase-like protein
MGEYNDDICGVPGILVGHTTNLEAGTGCTVVRCAAPALGAVDVRGGAPATRETNLLDPLCMMQEVHAVLLAGGSAFGLDAAGGVMRALEAQGIGFDVGVARVPIVPAAALFDLGLGRADVRPDAEAGAAAVAAARSGPVEQGCVGAGTGATVGKMAGAALAVKSGLGSASVWLPSAHIVGAIVAVNAAGDIYDDRTGRIVAGARSPDGAGWLMEQEEMLSTGGQPRDLFAGTNTTIAVVATDMRMSKADLAKVAQMAHDGLARVIRPVHTPFDGDTVFALSTASSAAEDSQAAQDATPTAIEVGMVGVAAADALARAVIKAVRAATSLHGVPAVRDLAFARTAP